MKRTLLIALLLVVCASPAFPQAWPGGIYVYSDAGYTDWNVYDRAPCLITLYVAHQYATDVGSVLFRLNVPDCVGGAGDWTLLGTIINWDLTIGDLFTGISIEYGECLDSPLLLATINYFGNGMTPPCPCCYISVVASPDAVTGEVEVVDCNLNRMVAGGGPAIINPFGDCGCGYPPVEETTWGQVKALYR